MRQSLTAVILILFRELTTLVTLLQTLLLLQIHSNQQFDAEAPAKQLRDSMNGLGNESVGYLLINLLFGHLAMCVLLTHAKRHKVPLGVKKKLCRAPVILLFYSLFTFLLYALAPSLPHLSTLPLLPLLRSDYRMLIINQFPRSVRTARTSECQKQYPYITSAWPRVRTGLSLVLANFT